MPLSWIILGILALAPVGVYGVMHVAHRHELAVIISAKDKERDIAIASERAANERQCKAEIDSIATKISEKALEDAREAWKAEQAVTPTPRERPAIDALCAREAGCREHARLAKK